MKILLVEDDKDLLKMAAKRLERKGAQVICSTTLKEACDGFYQNQDITGIICDFYLQNGENGIIFYEQHIREKYKGLFILATGDEAADPKIAQYKSKDKLFYCIEKPYSIEKILELILKSA